MGRAVVCEVRTGLIETELSVDGEANFGGVVVFLAVVFPPADRAQLQGSGRIEGFISTAGASIAHYDCGAHTGIDGKGVGRDYGGEEWSAGSGRACGKAFGRMR